MEIIICLIGICIIGYFFLFCLIGLRTQKICCIYFKGGGYLIYAVITPPKQFFIVSRMQVDCNNR